MAKDVNSIQICTSAKDLARNGDVEGALRLLEKGLRRAPHNYYMASQAGYLYFKNGNYRKAAQHFETCYLSAGIEKSSWIKCVTVLGFAYIELEKYAKAEQRLSKGLQSAPQDLSIIAALGKAYYCQGKFIEAEEILFEGLRLSPFDAPIRRCLAKTYERQGKYAEAKEEIMGVLERDPLDKKAQTILDDVIRQNGEPPLNQKGFTRKKKASIKPNVQEIFVEAKQLMLRSKLNEAASKLLSIIDYDAPSFSVASLLGQVYLRKKNYAEAERFTKQALYNAPNDAVSYRVLGNIYMNSGRFHEAREAFERAGTFDGKKVLTLGSLADLYQRSGKRNEAKIYLEKARKLDPNDSAITRQLGEFHAKDLDYAQAEEVLGEGVKRAPRNLKMLLSLGRVYEAQEKTEEAERTYENACAVGWQSNMPTMESDLKRALYYLGAVYLKRHRHDAFEALEQKAGGLMEKTPSWGYLTVKNAFYQLRFEEAAHRANGVLEKDISHKDAGVYYLASTTDPKDSGRLALRSYYGADEYNVMMRRAFSLQKSLCDVIAPERENPVGWASGRVCPESSKEAQIALG